MCPKHWNVFPVWWFCISSWPILLPPTRVVKSYYSILKQLVASIPPKAQRGLESLILISDLPPPQCVYTNWKCSMCLMLRLEIEYSPESLPGPTLFSVALNALLIKGKCKPKFGRMNDQQESILSDQEKIKERWKQCTGNLCRKVEKMTDIFEGDFYGEEPVFLGIEVKAVLKVLGRNK